MNGAFEVDFFCHCLSILVHKRSDGCFYANCDVYWASPKHFFMRKFPLLGLFCYVHLYLVPQRLSSRNVTEFRSISPLQQLLIKIAYAERVDVLGEDHFVLVITSCIVLLALRNEPWICLNEAKCFNSVTLLTVPRL